MTTTCYTSVIHDVLSPRPLITLITSLYQLIILHTVDLIVNITDDRRLNEV